MDLLRLIFGETAPWLASLSRFILPLVCVAIVVRCIRSMLRERYEPETWAYLYLPGEIMVPLRHWECILGRAKSVDGQLDDPSVEKLHACLIRDAAGGWTVYNLGRGDTYVNGEPVTAGGAALADADVLTLGKVSARFVDLTEEERAALLKYRHAPGRRVRPGATMLLLTVLQILLVLQQLVYNEDAGTSVAMAFGILCAAQWVYFCVLRASGQTGFEPETLGFFLTTIGLSVAASSVPDASSMIKQVIFILAGIVLFLILGLWIRDLKRTKSLNMVAAGASVILLAINLIFAQVTYGAQNWITIGGSSIQPSEFVKVLYIYASAATLERLFVNKNLIFYIGFSAVCVGAMALMGDFGAALVFFVTFLVISFMRSGSFATLFLAIGGAALAIMVVLSARPYVLARFQTWGHAWEDIYDTGYQQVRAMSAAASGGLFGQGSGNGWLVDVTAGDTDMVFGVVCEELGLITGLCCVASILALAGFVVKNASSGRSSYFVIAAAASVTVMMSQMALNVFGSMDILPFTGVTFPFVSRGGSSLLSCWMLLAFIKGCDTRARGSFAVKRPEKFSGGAGVEAQEDEDYDGYDEYGEYGPNSHADRRRAGRGRPYREDNR
ncbi:MAG: FtsW/RodA/SpoVE family cell cycle protein [Oscillospiraceae bacterium]|nr:FtsW/RodA/SpoVE family cell cycle protein [Oscillospiraceae bacterium]